ncbi:sulfurtransferase TusA family protein [Sulfurospirillum sp. T05]|uniref:Sulfurtransferase TusA family protein n=1 Tax=Sulfurospirillum tamanense TaxID=2813362 RepID=A0ABS2WS08_9BACT|nr:sulfurtransferase TusA family protein [Sulfurospirillum tamanensis]MBN2964385.1 sulfurtransferase TusA family protein [Sulfurospirillum tamanensis]
MSHFPHQIHEDFARFKEQHAAYLRGDLDALAFKTMRVPFGVYEQREADTYMVRIKLPGGKITPAQLRQVALLAKEYAHEHLHITTRGGVQLHNVNITSIIDIMSALHEVGLTGRGGGGNTVRNITADPLAGIAQDEAFDLSLHVKALSEKILASTDSYNLPRKYKIAFSSSEADRAHATISDVGFIAKVKDGQCGFALYVAGGMGAKSRLGSLFAEFIPEKEIHLYTQAIKQVFDRHGNRKNKHAARLRFLIEELGEESFRAHVEEELANVKAKGGWEIDLVSSPSVPEKLIPFTPPASHEAWWNRYVFSQKQAGLFGCKVPIYLGDIHFEHALKFADALEAIGEDVVRFNSDQNLYVRNLTPEQLLNLHEVITLLSPDSKLPTLFGDMVACTGAATCQLGIARPRGAVEAIHERLAGVQERYGELDGFKIHLSGCPNSCGKHLVADLGFFGKVARNEGYSYPAYNVVAGGSITGLGSAFAIKCGSVAAFFVPAFVEAVLEEWRKHVKQHASFHAWVTQAGGAKILETILEQFQEVPSFKKDKNPYFDYNCEELFSLKGRGTGECSAGMYDLIESDKKALQTALKEGSTDYKNIRFLSARMLLVTRGEDARDEVRALELFKKHFIETTLLNAYFGTLLEGEADERAVELAEEVLKLYERMDHTFHFAGAKTAQAPNVAEAPKAAFSAVLEKDYRGVACPMNFVKTKNDLSKMQKGEVLEILLDDGAPIDNVPRSVQSEGHKVEILGKEGEAWRVRIIKA